MTNTDAQECREAFEQWSIEVEHIAMRNNHGFFMYGSTNPWTAWQAAWNRRPTNEGITPSMDMVLIFLQAALDCPEFIWDYDQAEAAQECINEVRYLFSK